MTASLSGWLGAGVLVLVAAACASAPVSAGDPRIDAGAEIYGGVCSTCHGGNGEGGVGPNLSRVTITFPECDTHVRWVTLGSERWKAEVGPGYGSGQTPVVGAMPSFGSSLSEEQIRQVAAFERFRYGGASIEEALADCGLG